MSSQRNELDIVKSKRRNRLEIIKVVLELCLDAPYMKAAIMYRANLSYTQANEYLAFCVKIGLLKKQIEGSRVVYVTTKKGIKFIENFNKIVGFVGEETQSISKTVKIDEY